MTTPEGSVSRRTLMHAAWAVPVIALAVAAPAASASGTAPTLSLSAFPLGGNNNWATVQFTDATGAGAAQAFTYEGHDASNGSWSPIWDLATDSTGYFASTLPGPVLDGYDLVRVSANVSGYGLVVSNSLAVPIT